MKILVLLRRNILGQNNYSETKEAFLLLLRRRIVFSGKTAVLNNRKSKLDRN
ncbi:MAG: hypothetical protein ABIC18_00160 [Candidatus Omnitrophota bacterium]